MAEDATQVVFEGLGVCAHHTVRHPCRRGALRSHRRDKPTAGQRSAHPIVEERRDREREAHHFRRLLIHRASGNRNHTGNLVRAGRGHVHGDRGARADPGHDHGRSRQLRAHDAQQTHRLVSE
jgi:hypothetical protein